MPHDSLKTSRLRSVFRTPARRASRSDAPEPTEETVSESSRTAVATEVAQPSTRRELRAMHAAQRKRTRKRVLIGSAVAAVALLGTGGGLAAAGTFAPAPVQSVSEAEPIIDVRNVLALNEVTAKAYPRTDAILAAANEAAAAGAGKTDTSALQNQIAVLSNYKALSITELARLTEETKASTAVVSSAAAEADRVAAEAAAAAAAAAAEANTPEGAKKFAAQLGSSKYGWGDDQFQCLVKLWQKESNWNYQAENTSSGAYGIPQSLPGNKMASIAPDWETNAQTQVTWGLDYIDRVYGNPCSAWGKSQSSNWY